MLEKKNCHSFMMNDKIELEGKSFEITGLLPNRKVQVTNTENGRLTTLSPSDLLYNSLMDAKLEQINKSISNKPLKR
ncbi:hypothetical protein DET65_3502 [Sunxiuqinia elliptica]|uniref:Uncharacterized protein n=2 Tax=Sunxiuqinia elliptica TaxID=655355 RepID=A0A4R6H0R5_9BACT|nr:hypothetical protein DET52_105253 [Sunxiuqinia elliptica]TDO57905.1 hypothetical protein DET65_3502 [Sunxiuqinia elliptica]